MDWETDNFEETVDSFGTIKISNKRFGLFSKITSVGKRINSEYTVSGLFGRDIPELLKPSLTLTGHVGGLVLYEGSKIDGYIVLHHGDIYRDKRGTPLKEYRDKLIIRESQQLPFDSMAIPKLFQQMANVHTTSLSDKGAITGNLEIISSEDSLVRKKTIVVLGNCSIKIAKLDNKKIIVSGNLEIMDGAQVEESEMYAEKIKVMSGSTKNSLFYSERVMDLKGGNHNSQFFARDSIKISHEVTFGELSIICVNREGVKDSTVSGGVYFEENSTFTGTAISCNDSSAKNIYTGPSIVFGQNCHIAGFLITNHDIDIKNAIVKGNIWARNVVTTKKDQSYINYLVMSVIEKVDKSTQFPLLGRLPAKVIGTGYKSVYIKNEN
jgi:hypothetical protein